MLVKINGKPYKLEYDFNSVCEIEEVTGKSISELAGNKIGFGYKVIRAFFWGGLIKNNPGLEIEDAGNMIQEHIKGKPQNLEKLIEQVIKCMTQDGILDTSESLNDDFDNQETKKK